MNKEEVALKPELLSKTAFMFISTVGSAILGYIALFFATRFIGEINYGIVAFALSFAGIFLFVTDFGLGSAHTKKVSEGKNLQSCLSVFMLMRLLLIGIFTLLVFSALFFWEDVLGLGYENPDTHLVILIILLYYIQASITHVFTTTFLAQRDVVRAQAIALTDVMARALAILLVVAMNWGLLGLAWTYAIEGAVALIVALVLARGRLPKIRISSEDKKLLKEYLAFAAPLAISSIMGAFALYFDKIVIQYSMTSADTGAYFASQRLISFYLALSPVISSVVFPAMSHLHTQKNGKEKIAGMTSALIRYLVIVTVPLTFFLVVFSQDILSIFLSASFATGAMAFSILAFGAAITLTMISPFSSQILGMGMSRVYAKYQVSAIAITIILDILLIPSSLFSIPLFGWGINGAAISLAIGQVIIAAGFYVTGRKMLKMKMPKGIIRTMAAGAISILLVYLLANYVNIARFYDVAALFLVYAGLFVALLIAFKVITRQEIKELFKMLRPKYLLHKPSN